MTPETLKALIEANIVPSPRLFRTKLEREVRSYDAVITKSSELRTICDRIIATGKGKSIKQMVFAGLRAGLLFGIFLSDNAKVAADLKSILFKGGEK